MLGNRFLRSILAVLLSVSLCGCVSPKLFSIPLSTDGDDGKVVIQTTDSSETTAAEETTAEDYLKDTPQNAAELMSEEVSNRQEQLWDTEGTPAFYIPDYHSTRAMDVKSFEILDILADGKTVLYCYETAFYGDTSLNLGGASESGTAPEDFWKTHKNWDVKEGEDASKAPSTDWEVYCLMKYKTDTREYQILDYHVGRISSSSYSSEDADSGLLQQSYQIGQQRLFAGKVIDESKSFGTTNLYYCVYDMNFILLNSNMTSVKKTDLSSLIYTSLLDYFNQKFKWSSRSDWSEIQKRLVKGGMVFSVANVIMRDDGTLLLELNASLHNVYGEKKDSKDSKSSTDSQKIEDVTDASALDEDTTYSLLCSYEMYSLGDANGNVYFTSQNLAYEDQVAYWQDNTDLTYDDVLEEYPDRWDWCTLEGNTTHKYKLCAVRILGNAKTVNGDKSWGYFSRLFQRYFESMQEDATEEAKDKLWTDVYQELSATSWNQSVIRSVPGEGGNYGSSSSGFFESTGSYSYVMKNIARPTEVTGGNVQYLIDQSKEKKNICIGLFSPDFAKSAPGTGIGYTLFRNTDSSLEIAETIKEEKERLIQRSGYRQRDEDDEDDLSEHEDDQGYEDGYVLDDASYMETQKFTKAVRVKLSNSDAAMESFHVEELAKGRALEKSPSGEIFMYQDLSDSNTEHSCFWMPVKGSGNADQFRIDLKERISGIKVLYERKTSGDSLWLVAVLGEKNIKVFQCIWAAGSDGNYERLVKVHAIIPYTMAVTPTEEIGSTMDISYTDENGNEKIATVTQKASLTGNQAMKMTLTGNQMCFTTLQSGLQVYNMDHNFTTVVDAGQYYGCWQPDADRFTVIGFHGAKINAVYQDIMKAKIYCGLTISEEQKCLNTLKARLRVDTALRERFLKRPDGWKAVCEELGFGSLKDSSTLIEAYAKKIYGIYDAYDEALKAFWNCFLFQPTDQQKEEFTRKLQTFDSVIPLQDFIREQNEEYMKKVVETETEPETTTEADPGYVVDDGWIYKILDSQKEAKKKMEREKKVAQAVEQKEAENANQTLADILKAAKNLRNLWSMSASIA